MAGNDCNDSTRMTTSLPRAAYDGFWRRFVAYAIDYVLAIVASLVLVFAVSVFGLFGVVSETQLSLVVVLGYFLYCTLLESSTRQATLGKQVVGTKVTNRAGERIGFGRAAGRFFGKFLSAFTLFIGYWLIAVTARRQALHDLLAGTLVRHDHDPPRVAGWVVACIAAAAGVPLAAVFAAIVLPAYQDYTIRAQVSEGLALAAEYRIAVDTAWRSGRRELANLDADVVDLELPTRGRYVESVELVSGMIVVSYGGAANDAISGSVLAIVPALDAHDALGWACGYGPADAGFQVVFEDHEAYTDIPEQYLPSACRSRSLP